MSSQKKDNKRIKKEIETIKKFAYKLNRNFRFTSVTDVDTDVDTDDYEDSKEKAKDIINNCRLHFHNVLQNRILTINDLYEILENESLSFKEMLLLLITVPEINLEKFLSLYSAKIDAFYPFRDLEEWKKQLRDEEYYKRWLNSEKEYLAHIKLGLLNYFIEIFENYHGEINKEIDYNYLCEIFVNRCTSGIILSDEYYQSFASILSFVPQIPFRLLFEFLKACHFSTLSDDSAMFRIFNTGMEIPNHTWQRIFLKCQKALLSLSEEQKICLQSQPWFIENGLIGGNVDYRLDSIVKTYILPAFDPDKYPINDWDPVLKRRLEKRNKWLAKNYFE